MKYRWPTALAIVAVAVLLISGIYIQWISQQSREKQTHYEAVLNAWQQRLDQALKFELLQQALKSMDYLEKELQGPNLKARLKMAEQLRKDRKFEEILKLVTEDDVQQEEHRRIAVHKLRAGAFLDLAQYQNASNSCRRVLELDADNCQYRELLALCLLKLGRNDEGTEQLLAVQKQYNNRINELGADAVVDNMKKINDRLKTSKTLETSDLELLLTVWGFERLGPVINTMARNSQ